MKLLHQCLSILLFIFVTTNLSAQVSSSSLFTKTNSPVKAPQLQLKDNADNVITLNDFKGKTVVLSFWATWCTPCKKEMPSIQRLYDKVKNEDVEIIAITVGQNKNEVATFLNSLYPTPSFTILYDTDSSVSREWGIQAMPTTFIINKDGFITHYGLGARNFDTKALKELLLKHD